MNLFGVEISFGKNGKYIKREECTETHDNLQKVLDQRIADLKGHIDTRFEDYKDFFLKNGR